MSWIHIHDLVRFFHFGLMNENLSGPVKAVSPQPIRNLDFSFYLAQTLKKIDLFPIPKIILKILLGEISEMITASQRVFPERALQSQFNFEYPELSEALKEICQK